jgi:hypothetical protein
MKSVRLNDVGTVFKVTIKDPEGNIVDVSSASTKQFIFKKPNRSLFNKNASFFTDGTDGVLTYTTTSGVIDAIGIWQIQVYLIISAGTFRSKKLRFKVEEIFT